MVFFVDFVKGKNRSFSFNEDKVENINDAINYIKDRDWFKYVANIVIDGNNYWINSLLLTTDEVKADNNTPDGQWDFIDNYLSDSKHIVNAKCMFIVKKNIGDYQLPYEVFMDV